MDELDDLDLYNGDPIHDMYVDADYEINTGELNYAFDQVYEHGTYVGYIKGGYIF